MFQGPRIVRDVFRLAKENAPAIIFIDEVCTAEMNLSDEVDLEDYVSRPDKISGVNYYKCGIVDCCHMSGGWYACCPQEPVILLKDFEKGYRTNVKKPETDFDFYK
ncbi:26S protease regulatory subunit 6B-like protein [Rhynchospora pubera]|uniref:26S protease regulatory subunit 6B-like protein n=1 Tax=Rhynchospora pubera TaxID=906938 RepID=A0AAV8EMN8_9POAL|nr:26S protease regulatory subunit 6B-like protein [Rhynchospora pubera]